MNECEGVDLKKYTAPSIPYDVWSKEKLQSITAYIDKKLSNYDKPTVIVLEIGHFTLPKEEENLKWAYQNMDFSNEICKHVIQANKSKFKIIPTLLINNFDEEDEALSEEIIDDMLKNQKYINKKSLKTISERNLKNRAFKALKNDSKLTSQFIHIDGKAYLKDDDYQHDLAAGFVNEDGDIIPRCGLILTSFLDVVCTLAKQRLHQDKDINILFISFSQLFHEYKRVMLGVDIYSQRHTDVTIDPMIFHWNYAQDQAELAFKPCGINNWDVLNF